MTYPTRDAMAAWFAQEWTRTHSREAALARTYTTNGERTMKEHGTNPLDMSPWTREVINASLDAILERHRRMAHRAWVRAVERGDDDRPAYDAWMCARLHCGMRADV